MQSAFQPLTITVPRPFFRRLKNEANRRRTSVSGLLRDSFTFYTNTEAALYSNAEIGRLLKKDALPTGLKRDLDRLLK
ncbi:MAG: hypothetical protein Q7K39_00405 [Candidatus Magasanikbacteria bacterium]|nr:hypothetical protein [Candidatus Magasanikbacteria bacterium]